MPFSFFMWIMHATTTRRQYHGSCSGRRAGWPLCLWDKDDAADGSIGKQAEAMCLVGCEQSHWLERLQNGILFNTRFSRIILSRAGLTPARDKIILEKSRCIGINFRGKLKSRTDIYPVRDFNFPRKSCLCNQYKRNAQWIQGEVSLWNAARRKAISLAYCRASSVAGTVSPPRCERKMGTQVDSVVGSWNPVRRDEDPRACFCVSIATGTHASTRGDGR